MIKLSFLNLFRRKSRTALALLGIIIGITAIMGLVSAVDGTLEDINSIVANLQAVMVWEKDAIDQTLSYVPESYANKIEGISGVKSVLPEVWVLPTSIDGSPPGAGGSTFVYGTDPTKLALVENNAYFGPVERGSALVAGDSKKVVIGKSLAEDLDKFVGSKIKINGESFQVKGILETESSLYGNVMITDLESAREISAYDSDKVSSFYVELTNPERDNEVAQLIKFKFDDVDALGSSGFSEQFGSVLENFRLVVFIVAAISAFVAGVGIVNTMLMSVMERKREIGALRAVGWTNIDVIKMVMYEAVFIGFLGGVFGLASGYTVSWAVQEFAGVKTLVTLDLAVQSFMFAFILGLAAGIYPAMRASRLDPIEALRG
jgi:putative ABC transport system permease protein